MVVPSSLLKDEYPFVKRIMTLVYSKSSGQEVLFRMIGSSNYREVDIKV